MKKTPTLLLFGFSGLSLCFAFFKIITNLSLVTPSAIPSAQPFDSDASGLSVLFVCAISNITIIDPTSCNNNGTADPTDDYFTADIMISFTEPPATGNLELELSGAVLDVVSIPVGSLVGNTHTFEGVRLKANGMENPIEAQFSDLMSCVRTTFSPAVSPCSCAISTISIMNQSTCNNNSTADPTDDYFTADIIISFTEPPATGNLELELSGAVLDVVSIPVGSLVGNTHTFEDVRLKANGMANPIEAQFSDLMSCVRTTTAPAVSPCSCAISTISIIDESKSTCNNNGTLDETDDYYTADIMISFTEPPATGNLELEQSGAVLDVVSIPVGSLVGNTHTFEDVRLKANGMVNAIEAQFSDLMSCVRTTTASAVDPCSCEPTPSISLESSTICVGDTTTLTYSIAGFREAECIYNLRFSGPSGSGIIASSDTVPVAEKTIIVNNVLGPLGMPAGTYTFTLSGSCKGCEADTVTTTLTVTPGPSIGFELNEGEPDVICRGKSTQFKATASFLPSGNCDITGIRIGGQPGDIYIGPTCNGDDTNTYRTCFYVTGTSLPFNATAYKLMVNGVAYPIAFSNFVDSTEVVLCASNLPAGVTDVDVTVELADGCSFTVEDLYDAPPTCIVVCNITDFRLGGMPGDSYIGPTCNEDGTYRVAFYVSGTNLPANPIGYKIFFDGEEYPVAFSTLITRWSSSHRCHGFT